MSIDLEDFSTLLSDGAALLAASTEELEATKSASYEQGYSAGWDDAVRSEQEGQARIGSEFARNLQEMSLSFHEARAHVIESVRPVLQELVQTVLPSLVRDTMGQRIIEVIEPLMQHAADQPIVIAVAQGGRDALEPFLQSSITSTFELVEDATLADGQAYLRLGQVERKIDLTEALSQIEDALHALSNINERVLKYG